MIRPDFSSPLAETRSILGRLALAGVVAVASAATMAAQAPAPAAAAQAAPAAKPAAVTAEQAKPFVGEWTTTLDAPNGPAVFSITVKMNGDKVEAVVGNEMLGQSNVQDITMDGKAMVLSYTADLMGNQAQIAVMLTPSDDKLKTDFSFMGGQFQLSGVATRKAK